METRGEFFADKLMDLANLAVVVLVFEQVAKGQINGAALTMALAFFFAAVMLSYFMRRREKKSRD